MQDKKQEGSTVGSSLHSLIHHYGSLHLRRYRLHAELMNDDADLKVCV
jgi:hypothetical protein